MIRDPRRVEVLPIACESGCRSYVVIARDTGEAAVIDPLLATLSETLAALDAARCPLRFIFETHSHGDHLSGARALRERLGGDLVAHPDLPGETPTVRAADGQAFPFGEHGLTVHHAPGNAADAIVVEAAGCYFTGDTILIGTVGLQDTGSVSGKAWYETLDRIFGAADDETVLHIGHDDMGRDLTTLGAERRGNRWLREDDIEKFVSMVAGDTRDLRKDREAVREANREGLLRVPRALDAAAGLIAPAERADRLAAAGRGQAPASAQVPALRAHHGVLVLGGVLAAMGTILGWYWNPALHGLSLLAAVILLAFGLPAFERSRAKGKRSPLYYEGPERHRLTNDA